MTTDRGPGRPPTYPGEHMVRVTVQVPAGLLDALDAEVTRRRNAGEQSASRASVIAEVLRDRLA